MPVYTIGKNHQPVSPAATKMDDKGLKPDKNITNEEVNKWFDDAFRKFMQDPYVELNPGNLSDCTGFYTLSMDDENGLSLKNILTTLRELAPPQLSAVFGCGGDRDRSKRPFSPPAQSAKH